MNIGEKARALFYLLFITGAFLMLTLAIFVFSRCVCNIDCSQTNFNPLCASDGKSYDNACQIKEASCQKQEKIEVMSLGRCQGNAPSKSSWQRKLSVLLILCRNMGIRSSLLSDATFIDSRVGTQTIVGCGDISVGQNHDPLWAQVYCRWKSRRWIK